MNFYNIKDDYIDYLRRYDLKVAINKEESRPYVGTVLIIDDIKYFAPLSSPKAKHLKMKNGKDFRKIDNGKLGAINLNNMIPVIDDALIPINFDEVDDVKYRELLRRQYSAIRNDEDAIISNAYKLRELALSDESTLTRYDLTIKARCCDFVTLEAVFQNFTKGK